MKKILLLLFLIPNITFAFPTTLNEYMSEYPSWSSTDRASLSYITLRCGILFEVLSGKYKNISDAEEIYNMSLTNAAIFSRVSSDIYKTSCINFACIKVEKKASQKKAIKWTSIYEEQIVRNV